MNCKYPDIDYSSHAHYLSVERYELYAYFSQFDTVGKNERIKSLFKKHFIEPNKSNIRSTFRLPVYYGIRQNLRKDVVRLANKNNDYAYPDIMKKVFNIYENMILYYYNAYVNRSDVRVVKKCKIELVENFTYLIQDVLHIFDTYINDDDTCYTSYEYREIKNLNVEQRIFDLPETENVIEIPIDFNKFKIARLITEAKFEDIYNTTVMGAEDSYEFFRDTYDDFIIDPQRRLHSVPFPFPEDDDNSDNNSDNDDDEEGDD
jgi:hypothetical protein